ncbi:putative secreted protein (Por secretion system target) [Gillisia mitskevichiae]|uniref:Putative secreted protein (Por secretion system target) n=1 Tax=Gillisia mitskevichiae TaxID=270921 RepID=A0A495PM62_9FLAO|nr:endonuclease/exonuclease/phosphatase family protein [Gillisia mitskevichiae]RKS50548.1 putative secreted protein (Por secretion system target) [Gillisia mitskevichiae]
MKKTLPYRLFFVIFLLFSITATAQEVFVNEIHYDNNSGDIGEGIEIAGPAATDLAGWSIVEYNGNGGGTSGTTNLSGVIPDLQGGYGVIFFPISGLQNGSPDGFALVNNLNEVVQFLSYEGVIIATDGIANGFTSTDIGVSESGTSAVDFSLQLAGTGQQYQDFTWQESALNTYDAVNNAQDFGGEVVPPTIVINEVDSDTDGTDILEFVELYDGGVGNSSLDGKALVLFNGSNKLSYRAIDLTGYSTDANGYFVIGNTAVQNVGIVIPSNALQNGADAVALYESNASNFPNGTAVTTDNLIDAFVYDTNDSDEAELLVLLNEAQPQINEDGMGDKDAHSSQRYPNGSGGLRNTITYTQALPTPGKANTNITEPVNLVINELDADTPGSDSQEFLELYDGGKGNTPLDGFIVVTYNGNGDKSYGAYDLTGQVTNAEGYFVMGNADVENVNMVVSSNTFQNGADAVALYQDVISNFPNGTEITLDNLVDALVYGTDDAQDEELIVLLNEGQIQADENANGSQADESLQRFPNGQGGVRNTAFYIAAKPSPGTENGAIVPQTELLSIAEARVVADNETVTITGTLTVSDQFSGPAYIQDETGAMAIYDALVHGRDNFKIGDSITVTGTKITYNGQIEISPVSRVDFEGQATNPIEPLQITLAELSQHPDELVTITDITFSEDAVGDLIFGGGNYNVSDASGPGVFRIDPQTSAFVGKAIPASCVQITGIAADVYFNIIPRILEDFPCAGAYDNTGTDSAISRELTLDVVTWNIEWFGDETNTPVYNNPNSDEIQKEKVKAILLDLDADVIGVEEISDDVLFGQMVSEMEGYDYVLSDATSYPESPGGQKVGFIYRTDVISVKSTRAMFKSVHPFYDGDGSLLTDYPESADRFYASGRLPFMMEADVTLNGQTSTINFVGLHARANGSTDSQSRYDMRKYDVEVLKDSLDMYYANKNVMILGDYNDDVDVTVADGINTTVSTYQAYVNDTENYNILTAILSEQGFRSYAFRENMIDHIMVTSELSENFVDGSARVHYEYYDSEFTTTASDHFPVSVRMILKNVEITSIEITEVTCNGTATGTATVNVDGGILPYTYAWSDGQTSKTAVNLVAGTYFVEVTDGLGNTVISNNIVISEAAALQLTLIEDQLVYSGYDTTCTLLGATEISGGRGEYMYSWSTGETTETISVCPSETTEYTLVITDSNGCTAEDSVVVTVQDVACGNGNGQDKVQLCFNGKSLCVAMPAVEAHLRKGAILGSCSGQNVVIEAIAAAPNPTNNFTTIRVSSAENYKAEVLVFDLNGILLNSQKVQLKKGNSDFIVNLSKMITGMYVIQVKGATFESTPLKVMKY